MDASRTNVSTIQSFRAIFQGAEKHSTIALPPRTKFPHTSVTSDLRSNMLIFTMIFYEKRPVKGL